MQFFSIFDNESETPISDAARWKNESKVNQKKETPKSVKKVKKSEKNCS